MLPGKSSGLTGLRSRLEVDGFQVVQLVEMERKKKSWRRWHPNALNRKLWWSKLLGTQEVRDCDGEGRTNCSAYEGCKTQEHKNSEVEGKGCKSGTRFFLKSVGWWSMASRGWTRLMLRTFG